MVKLWRCQICGEGYVGKAAPENCPFCGAHKKDIVLAKDANVTFDVELNEIDKKNVEYALQVEVSNSAFYFCAAGETDNPEGKLLFKTLAKVEGEHASIWRKLLKMPVTPKGEEKCHIKNLDNLKESHARETKAIEFYRKAESEAKNQRVKELFAAVVEVEMDHLQLDNDYIAANK